MSTFCTCSNNVSSIVIWFLCYIIITIYIFITQCISLFRYKNIYIRWSNGKIGFFLNVGFVVH